ncbi:MAG: hypothetical protein JF588_01385 [Caulobacterales bacterium]|nr:hypothetical protein [Caulobacterales bacterium]
MRSHWRRGAALAAALGAALAVGGLALAAGAEPPLRAMRWAPRDADPARAFATQPAECLKPPPTDPAAALSVEIGRAAFRAPVLLGGQAARAGLSCEACHRGGRTNPDFLFPGASGAPGTADVTLSLFSSHRGDGAFNPRPIPDLSGPRMALKVAPADLPAFIHGLITQEFDGPEPPPAVLAGLAAYVRALDPAACPAPGRTPLTVAFLMADARRALAAARGALDQGDRPTARLMIASARARLFLIDERFAALPAEQARLRTADAGLAALQAKVSSGAPDAAAALDRWLAESRPLEARLAARAPQSLFDPKRLAAASNRRLPARPS